MREGLDATPRFDPKKYYKARNCLAERRTNCVAIYSAQMAISDAESDLACLDKSRTAIYRVADWWRVVVGAQFALL